MREALDDRLDRLDLVDRHRWALAVRNRNSPRRVISRSDCSSTARGVLLEDVVAARPGGVLQPEHGLRVEQVQLALAAPLVLAADLAGCGGSTGRRCSAGRPRVCRRATSSASTSSPMPPRTGRGAGEVAVDQLLVEPDGLEDLRPVVGRDGRDAHLRHHLEHALAERLDEVAHRLVRSDPGTSPRAARSSTDLHRQVGVDRRRRRSRSAARRGAPRGRRRPRRGGRPGCGSAAGSGGGARRR